MFDPKKIQGYQDWQREVERLMAALESCKRATHHDDVVVIVDEALGRYE